MRAYRNPRGNRREGAKRELSHSALYNVGENGRECRKEYTTELLRGRTQQQADLIEAQRNVGTSGESDERAAACCMLHVACRVLRVLCACVWTTFERSKLFADPPPRLTRLRTNNVQHGTWHAKYNMAHGIQRTTWHMAYTVQHPTFSHAELAALCGIPRCTALRCNDAARARR